MKKLVAVLVAGAFVLGNIAVAGADPVVTPVGTATVNEGGYVVVLDGNDDNFGPVAGYVSVSSGGRVCADDNGGWGTPGTSPTCS